jgi:hypothetical protein
MTIEIKEKFVMARRNHPLLWISALLLLVSMSCQLLTGVQKRSTPTVHTTSRSTPISRITPTRKVVKVTPPGGYEGTAVPVSNTPVHTSVDNIQVDYVYTDSLVTALYHLYGSVLDHFVDITLTNDGASAVKVIVQSEIEGYTTTSSNTVEIPAHDSVQIHQDPILVPEAVDKLNAQKPGAFHIRAVYVDNGKEETLLDETQQILIYSRRDFVWIKGFTTQEEYELWAAWVTPNDPAVEKLIRAAANYDSTGSITSGYGDEEDDGDGSVWRRLEAVWQAESNDYHITYISTMTTFGPNSVQRMRLPAEVLDQASGNCVELAALYASVAEALGLETAIIRIPGHAFTAIRTDEVNSQYYFIETTMIGQADFADAVKEAGQEWDDAKPHFDANEEGYAWVTIPDARKKGILPIPWK